MVGRVSQRSRLVRLGWRNPPPFGGLRYANPPYKRDETTAWRQLIYRPDK
jgi:hypothetical protein